MKKNFPEKQPNRAGKKPVGPSKSRRRNPAAKGREGTRLNKYLAHAGIASRREADKLIASGLVQINGEIVTEMGHMVQPTDEVKFNNSAIKSEKKVYIALNKPKGFISTVDDPKARKTVMDLVGNAVKERIYPVGRLDRQTTGMLLFTNDGELAKKLTHPSYGARKIYHVTLDKNLELKDFHAIERGLSLEDGDIKVDEISFIDGKSRNHVGVVLHSGKNRIVRRIFGHLDYEVLKLDRVLFAGISKKGIPRGQWRKLDEKEVGMLKMH